MAEYRSTVASSFMRRQDKEKRKRKRRKSYEDDKDNDNDKDKEDDKDAGEKREQLASELGIPHHQISTIHSRVVSTKTRLHERARPARRRIKTPKGKGKNDPDRKKLMAFPDRV